MYEPTALLILGAAIATAVSLWIGRPMRETDPFYV